MIDCVLLQNHLDGRGRPIEYFSSLLNDTKQAYDVLHHDCLPVVQVVLLPCSYFSGGRVIVLTECNAAT